MTVVGASGTWWPTSREVVIGPSSATNIRANGVVASVASASSTRPSRCHPRGPWPGFIMPMSLGPTSNMTLRSESFAVPIVGAHAAMTA